MSCNRLALDALAFLVGTLAPTRDETAPAMEGSASTSLGTDATTDEAIASKGAPGPPAVTADARALESSRDSLSSTEDSPAAISLPNAHPLPPLPSGSSTSGTGKPRSGSALMSHHHANASLESLPVLPEEEEVEIQFDMTSSTAGSAGMADLHGATSNNSSSGAKPGSSRNLSLSTSTSTSTSSSGGTKGGAHRGTGVARPPMVSRVHSVDAYNLDNDAMIAMSMGSLGDGGTESEHEHDDESASGQSTRRITTSAAAAATTAPSRQNNKSTKKGPDGSQQPTSPSKPPAGAPPARAVSAHAASDGSIPAPNTYTSGAAREPPESTENEGGGAIVNDEGDPSDDSHREDDEVEEEDGDDRIRLGICAMDKKARSKPMAEILSRLDESLFQVVFFGDDLIKHSPIEEWPVCDGTAARCLRLDRKTNKLFVPLYSLMIPCSFSLV
jgi:Diphosphoinositol pentakisphosphate kinase 2 N-terminal domain